MREPGRERGEQAGKVEIRAVCADDLARIEQIERISYSDPWPLSVFRDELANRASQGLVAVSTDGEVVGYCFYWTVGEEADIHTVTVAPECRRRGVASRLLHSVIQSATSGGVRRLLLEVRSKNRAAIALYHKHGFVQDSVRRGYYGGGDDAVLMSRAVE
jgi:ribosomal-protein-alanine N-acetyltransferase